MNKLHHRWTESQCHRPVDLGIGSFTNLMSTSPVWMWALLPFGTGGGEGGVFGPETVHAQLKTDLPYPHEFPRLQRDGGAGPVIFLIAR